MKKNPTLLACPDCGKMIAIRLPVHNCVNLGKLTKLEAFVWRNRNLTFHEIATQVNRPHGAVYQAFLRAKRKLNQ